MKKYKIIFWVSTIIFVLFDSGGALFFNTSFAKMAMAHLGFPNYFGIELALGKIIGGLILVIPAIPARFKEWAYVGFGISLISAFIANWAVDGASANLLFVIVVAAVLYVSYHYYHKLNPVFKKHNK